MRFSRHAKNKARLLRISIADAEAVIADPVRVDRDESGKPKYIGAIRGVRVCIVVALDEPDWIVTIHERRR